MDLHFVKVSDKIKSAFNIAMPTHGDIEGKPEVNNSRNRKKRHFLAVQEEPQNTSVITALHKMPFAV